MLNRVTVSHFDIVFFANVEFDKNPPAPFAMAFFKCALLFVALFAMMAASPVPEPSFFGPKHEHVVIHVPYKVHTVHHHHVHKEVVPIIKAVPIIKEVPVYKEIHYSNDYHHHGGWW